MNLDSMSDSVGQTVSATRALATLMLSNTSAPPTPTDVLCSSNLVGTPGASAGASALTAEETAAVSLTPHQQMLSSGAGALMVCLFMTPLDVVKIRLQAQSMVFGKKCFLYSNGIMDHLCPRVNGDPPAIALHTTEEICNCKWYNRPKYFNGTLDAFVKIARTEGVSSLWSGLSPTLVVAVPTVMIYFTTYEQVRDLLHRSYQRLSFSPSTSAATNCIPEGPAPPWISLSAGALSRIWAVTVVSPLELVRTKMQSQKMAFYQVRSCLVDLVRSHGIRGLWSGYTATLLRDVPFSALYWPLFEGVRHSFGPDNFGANFVSGAVAGSVASAATLPFDVIKTLKQIEIGDKDIMQVKTGVAKSNSQIARDIMREHGFRGFFAGLVPRILKVAPACAIMISSYEFFKTFFRSRNGSQTNSS